MSFIVALILELLTAVLRAFLLPIIFLIALLLWLLELLLRLWRARSFYPEETGEGCPPLPEAVVRRPDPCIYSQELLMAQGVPVTWNNPDIWIAPASNPAAIMPDSYHLADDTDYLVTVQVHNASTDAALGVRVRLRHRSWGINVPDLQPVETDGMGQEVSRYVDVAPMGATLTVFKWHTQKLAPGEVKHYCLQASLEHPLDVNTANNVGQENTNVYAANPGEVTPNELVDVVVPLFNAERVAQPFRFEATMYQVDTTQMHTLRLRANPGYRRWSLAQRVANVIPTMHPRPPAPGPREREERASRPARGRRGGFRFAFFAQRPLVAIRTKYVGLEAVRDRLRKLDVTPPPAMAMHADGRPFGEPLEVGANVIMPVHVTLTIPADARPGALFPINIIAKQANGVLVGGVTLLLQVKE